MTARIYLHKKCGEELTWSPADGCFLCANCSAASAMHGNFELVKVYNDKN